MKEVPVYNVGELREALMGLPDNNFIHTQVVFGDGVVWNMHCKFIPQIPGGTAAALVMDHPQATTPSILPRGVLDQIYGMSREELQKHSEPAPKSSFAYFLEGYERREKEYEAPPAPPLLLGEFITEVTAYHVQYDQTYNLRPFLTQDDIGRKGGFKVYLDQGRLRLIADGLYC